MRQSIINKLNSNNMSKKVIEQIKVVKYFGKGEKEPTVIDNPSARELTTVAKAIDPEYQKVEDELKHVLNSERIWSEKCNFHYAESMKYQSENKTLIDQNAKLVEALEKLLSVLPKGKSLEHYFAKNEVRNAIEALQNNKKIEG